MPSLKESESDAISNAALKKELQELGTALAGKVEIA
jgi:hypothetical protein